MSDTFQTVTTEGITLKRGTDLRVSVTGYGDRETHYGITVRQWVTESTASIRGGITVGGGSGKARSTYTGPDGRHGLSILSPSQALALAEMLTRAAVDAEGREDGTEVAA